MTAPAVVLDLFDVPRTEGPFHARGSETSREAAERVQLTLAARQDAVLAALRFLGPSTAEEIADHLGWDRWVTQPRLSELKLLGRVRKTTERRKNRSGRSATVWSIAP